MAYVYLIVAENAVKIGVSRNPEHRLSGFQTSHYEQLKLYCTLKCMDEATAYQLEDILHRRYAPHNIRGEWFRIDPDTIFADLKFASAVGARVTNFRLYAVPKQEDEEPLFKVGAWSEHLMMISLSGVFVVLLIHLAAMVFGFMLSVVVALSLTFVGLSFAALGTWVMGRDIYKNLYG